MLVPPHIRHASRRRNEDCRPTAAVFTKLVSILAGRHERFCLPSMQDEALKTFPNAQLVLYDDCGHAPFWENAARFNQDLADFVAYARQQSETKK